jgi:hypothetical protein
MAPVPISGDEKRQALERVLESRTLGRSDQLRSFLRYICEAEFEGHAQQLNEYALGVSVLGRPADYSPAEDSCVRTRAYELRNKLKSYYQSEAPEEPIRIEIDKGAYVPRFERWEAPAPADSAPQVAQAAEPEVSRKTEAPAEVPPPARSGILPRLSFVLLLVAVGLLSASLYVFSLSREPAPARSLPPTIAARVPQALATREMAALWQPFLESRAPLIISFEIRLFFFAPDTGLVVRDYLTNQPAEAAKSKPLLSFQERMGAHELRATYDYADFGAVHAVFLLGRLLNRDVALKHASSLGWEDIWNSNIIFIGKADLHPTIRHALKDLDFVATENGDIHNLHPLRGEPEMYTNPTTHGAGEKYAFITVLPGFQPGLRMMILSGGGAELMWALAESVSDPLRVKEIMSHLLSSAGEAPAAFQVVIAASFESNVPVKIRYVTHRVSKPR